jgi:D-alanyl-D-alanine carboxypeptidase
VQSLLRQTANAEAPNEVNVSQPSDVRTARARCGAGVRQPRSRATQSCPTSHARDPRRSISSAYRKRHTCWQHHAALNGGVTHGQPARPATRRTRIRRIRVVGLLLVIAAIAAALSYQLPASSSSTPSSSSTAASPIHALRSEHRGALGEADGAVPDGTTVFDDEIPGVAKLDSGLLGALRQAATDAAGDGVEFVVDSGWRSPAYQEQLLHEAVLKYGSEAEASRWVATPSTSAHVSGDAVDIGPSGAAAWLSEHGAPYGLCQVYGNEPWHYELRPEAIYHGCPAVYADPTHDPRMQR